MTKPLAACFVICIYIRESERRGRQGGREGQRGKFKEKEGLVFKTKHIVKVGEAGAFDMCHSMGFSFC
jgi:hypothetical protein